MDNWGFEENELPDKDLKTAQSCKRIKIGLCMKPNINQATVETVA